MPNQSITRIDFCCTMFFLERIRDIFGNFWFLSDEKRSFALGLLVEQVVSMNNGAQPHQSVGYRL